MDGIQKPNIKPNTEPFPNCCFFHDKGVLGSNSRDAFTLRILSYSVPKILRFLAFFHKTNEKPYSHDIHALTRKSRQSIIFTLDLNEIWGFNSINRVTILTEVHVLHACVHFSLSKPALQEIIISNFKACIHAIFAWIQAFSFVFISKMLECYFVRYKNPTKTQHKFSRFVRIFPYL